MAINFVKMGDEWCMASRDELVIGSVVDVTKRSGEVKRETVGALRRVVSGGEGYVYAIAKGQLAAKAVVGDLSGILALFGKARTHLKRPAIMLGVPALGDFLVRINVAGPQSKAPGSLQVLGAEREDDGSEQGRRPWYGRVTLDGLFQAGRDLSTEQRAAIADRLQAFAASPAQVAAEHGRLTGRCCFCNIALKDERSTAVGYGRICADHYGLEWGARRHSFTAEAAA